MPKQQGRMTYEQQRAKRQTTNKGTAAATHTSRKIPILPITFIVLVLVAAIFALNVCSSAMTIDVTINGVPYTLRGAKTIATAVKESGLPINPGDLISLRGVVLKRSGGHPITATVNGKDTTDLNFQLHDKDVLVISDGKDVVEEYDLSEERTEHSATVAGAGAIHEITPGNDGVMELRTGKISGEEVRWRNTESADAVCIKWNPDVGEDKVIALTFEGGPSSDYTGKILDILKENEAKATFFVVGMEIEKYHDELLIREYNEGHQIGTGTYNMASEVSGSKISKLTRDELSYQIGHGLEVIGTVLKEGQYSKIARLPGGRISDKMVIAIDSHVTANIGWNVDTGDWMESTKNEILKVLMLLEPGDVVRLHDGGGDMSGTVEALREALPLLRERGYRFITIDELMKYEAQ